MPFIGIRRSTRLMLWPFAVMTMGLLSRSTHHKGVEMVLQAQSKNGPTLAGDKGKEERSTRLCRARRSTLHHQLRCHGSNTKHTKPHGGDCSVEWYAALHNGQSRCSPAIRTYCSHILETLGWPAWGTRDGSVCLVSWGSSVKEDFVVTPSSDNRDWEEWFTC